MTSTPIRALAVAAATLLWSPPAPAQMADDSATQDGLFDGPIAGALERMNEDVRVFNDHVVTLANPYMEGRLPGTKGMELAKDYVQYWLEDAGLQPAFADVEHTEGNPWRQPFELSSLPELDHQHLSLDGVSLEAETDYRGLAVGQGGELTAPLVFVGYSIDEGPDGYSSYAEGDDLAGRIAVMLRFEPMDAEGKSLWSDGGGWSRHASFLGKLRAVAKRNASGVIIINTPGAADPRTEALVDVRGAGSQPIVEGPVAMLARDSAAGFLQAAGADLDELKAFADGHGGVLPLDGEATLSVTIKRERFVAENVGGLLRGRGDLADELIVVGAHLDHLGMGFFGSRSGSGELHPGADDNATGSAAVMMLGERLVQDYAALPEDASARSVAFVLFSAEESGLNGARHYVNNPLGALEDHALMINFDMIGRIKDKKLSVSGGKTAAGMSEWLDPILDRSPLTIVQPEGVASASDHAAFMSREVPVLFGIIADLHGDYHTPADVSWKINREDAVHTVNLFHEIAHTAATLPGEFRFVKPAAGGRRGGAPAASGDTPTMGAIKVRFGIAPGNYDGEKPGVLVGGVSDDTSASAAGIRAGDRLVSWNGEPIAGVMEWMGQLAGHEPGDVVKVGVQRGDEDLVLDVTLRAKGSQ